MTFRPNIALALICIAILGLGYFDYVMGFQISLFPLYVLAAVAVSWNNRLAAAIATSAVACVVIVIKAFGETFSHEIYRYWEIISKIFVLFLVTWATWKIRQLSAARDMANHHLTEVVNELMQARQALRQSNELLEKKVAERTQDLTAMIDKLEAEVAERTRLALALDAESNERLRAEVELHQNELLLLQQSRMAAMGEMIGNITHQWRQPLNTLNLIAQELLIYYKMGNFTEEYLRAEVEKTMATIRYMSRTIDDFRNFFRPDKEKVEFKAVDVINNTLSLVAGSLRQLGISVEIATSGDPVINGFPNEFSQVILNILGNARDAFSTRRIEAPKLTITVGTEDGKTVLTFLDNAGGIPEEIIEKIFEPYFTTKGEEKGTGVGLYMSKRIIEKSMNGTITARNVRDGAEFRIEV